MKIGSDMNNLRQKYENQDPNPTSLPLLESGGHDILGSTFPLTTGIQPTIPRVGGIACPMSHRPRIIYTLPHIIPNLPTLLESGGHDILGSTFPLITGIHPNPGLWGVLPAQ